MLNESCVASSMFVYSCQPGRASLAREAVVESDGQRVHRTLKRIAKARASLDAQEAAALREAQRMRLWEQFGYTSLVDYMERELGYTARAAVERIRVAIAIEALPQFEAALDQGALSFSGAKELTRVVTPETQDAWLEATQDKNVRQIEEMVSGHKPGDLPTSPVGETLRTKVLRFEVELDTAALVRDYQKQRARQLGNMIDDDLLLREVFQLALDRMVEDRRRSDDSKDSSAPSAVAKPRYQISISVCDDCNRGWLLAAGKTTLLAPADLAAARCDAHEIGRVDIADDAQKRMSIPPARRRKVLARDKHRCRVPGCQSTNIDIHHLEPVELGGSNEEANLMCLCEAHHLALHRGKLVITGSAIEAQFTFVAANRFAIEARVVETKRELERRGCSKQQAIAVVEAVRAHAGDNPHSSHEWLELALRECERSAPTREDLDRET